jgi:hypothetical protein
MLTPARLRELLSYDPVVGEWRWLISRGNVRCGSIAGTINKSGYRHIGIDGHRYTSNRLAILYMTGSWPVHMVDHKNGITDDDRWDNLRMATNAQNQYNSKLRSDNTSGFRGVSFDKNHNRWRVTIRVDGKERYIGRFATREEGAMAYGKESERLHGEFARKT